MKPIDIFWTGGLDCTFGVLEPIFVEKRILQPYYIIDSSRSSTLFELRSIEKIKAQLTPCVPFGTDLLLPLKLLLKTEIQPNEEITHSHENLINYTHMDAQ